MQFNIFVINHYLTSSQFKFTIFTIVAPINQIQYVDLVLLKAYWTAELIRSIEGQEDDGAPELENSSEEEEDDDVSLQKFWPVYKFYYRNNII